MRRFIGVSLGGARGKTTAIARLEWRQDGRPLVLVEARIKSGHRGSGEEGLQSAKEDKGASLGYFRDSALLEYLRQWPAQENVLAMDVPMRLPPCIGCQRICPGSEDCEVPQVVWMRSMAQRLLPRSAKSDKEKPQFCPYSERPADLLHAYFSCSGVDALTTAVGPQAARAQYLQQRLHPDYRQHHNWVEVSPRTAIARAMGAELELRTRRGSYEELWLARREVLLKAIDGLVIEGVWPDLVARNVHVFRALVSAWLAHRWHVKGRPRLPAVRPRSAKEQQVIQALDPALDWAFWDETQVESAQRR